MDNKFDELREALENVDTEKFAENKADTVDDFSSIGTITIDSSSSYSYGNIGIGSGQFWCSTASSYANVTIGAAGSSGQFLTSGLNGTS
jgi:hypothetical protein